MSLLGNAFIGGQGLGGLEDRGRQCSREVGLVLEAVEQLTGPLLQQL